MNGIFWVCLAILIVFLVPPRPSACNEPDAKEGQSASTDKLASILCRGSFKIAVEYCRSTNNGQCEENELNRNDLGGVESLERPINVFDLHDCCANKDSDK